MKEHGINKTVNIAIFLCLLVVIVIASYTQARFVARHFVRNYLHQDVILSSYVKFVVNSKPHFCWVITFEDDFFSVSSVSVDVSFFGRIVGSQPTEELLKYSSQSLERKQKPE